MQRTSVDLPQPDSPTIPSVSPCCSVNETPSTAFTVGDLLLEDDPAGDREVLLQVLDDEQLVARAHGASTDALAHAPRDVATSFAASRAFVASSRWQACSWVGVAGHATASTGSRSVHTGIA